MPSYSLEHLIEQLHSSDTRALARCLSLVENESTGSREILESLRIGDAPVIGLTGPPGAGKSTLVNALVKQIPEDRKVGVIAVDPSSPFNFGALLGDRIRMAEQFGRSNIFIRSMASRGSLGGLSNKIREATDLMRAFGFDYIFIETVGVGQSEVEVAGLADTTVVVLVPEAGDHVQTMKAGLMEIADVFVVNKADRPEAEKFASELAKLVHERASDEWQIPVLQTVAHAGEGVEVLLQQIGRHHRAIQSNERRILLTAEKAYQMIREHRMAGFDRSRLLSDIRTAMSHSDFNLYRFIGDYEN